MEWALVIALILVMSFVTLACAALVLARNRVNQRHRVDPKVRTDAPLTWLVDPRTPARLHRRLAKVGTTASMVADDHKPPAKRFRKVEPTPMMETALDVRAQAVALDAQLTRVAHLSTPIRRQHLPGLARSVAEVEAATAQLVALSTDLRQPRRLPTDPEIPTDQTTLTAIAEQMDRLAAAHGELAALDRDNGLTTQPATVRLPAAPTSRTTPSPRTSPATGPGVAGRAF